MMVKFMILDCPVMIHSILNLKKISFPTEWSCLTFIRPHDPLFLPWKCMIIDRVFIISNFIHKSRSPWMSSHVTYSYLSFCYLWLMLLGEEFGFSISQNSVPRFAIKCLYFCCNAGNKSVKPLRGADTPSPPLSATDAETRLPLKLRKTE